MTITKFKRRSINLDDSTYKRGKLLADKKALGLSALLRVLINETYEAEQAKKNVKRVG